MLLQCRNDHIITLAPQIVNLFFTFTPKSVVHYQHYHPARKDLRATEMIGTKKGLQTESIFCPDHLFENFFTALSALFWAFVGRVAVYLLRTVESSGLLYAAGGNFK